jgi:hypothetical protein
MHPTTIEDEDAFSVSASIPNFTRQSSATSQLSSTSSRVGGGGTSGISMRKPRLPKGKHAFLSYQWDVQVDVVRVKEALQNNHVKCWMDISGGMKTDIYDSMAEGVQGAACILCFMTQAYQDSTNCKLELKFAQQSGVPIVPVMMEDGFSAKGWLGILTSGSIWTTLNTVVTGNDPEDAAALEVGVKKLVDMIQKAVGIEPGESDSAGSVADDVSEFGGSMYRVEVGHLSGLGQHVLCAREDCDGARFSDENLHACAIQHKRASSIVLVCSSYPPPPPLVIDGVHHCRHGEMKCSRSMRCETSWNGFESLKSHPSSWPITNSSSSNNRLKCN